MKRLEVKPSMLQFIVVNLLGLFFILLGALSVYNVLAKGRGVIHLIIGIMPLIFFLLVVWLVRRGYVNSVRYFSDEGLVRNDGKRMAWKDLKRVVNQITVNPKHNSLILWRVEIQFNNGESAWLIPSKVRNFHEVSEFVRNLPCEHKEVRV